MLLSATESTLRDDVSLQSRSVCLESADVDLYIAHRLTSSSALPCYVLTYISDFTDIFIIHFQLLKTNYPI